MPVLVAGIIIKIGKEDGCRESSLYLQPGKLFSEDFLAVPPGSFF
jgi:hypothetical protein